MDYDDFLRSVCPRLDLQWRKYRRRSARRRVEGRMAELGLSAYADYARLLHSDPGETEEFPRRVRVTLSRFFREHERWEALADAVIPALLAPGGDRPLRVWSAGCCNGEEPYTLALLWLERVEPRFPGALLDLLATDLDERVLGRARRAEYAERTLREVPGEIRTRRFRREDEGWRLDPAVAARVRFRRHDLLGELPPAGMDLVLCRYLVFTYFEGDRRFRAAERLARALRPGGALMIGRKEGLGSREERELFAPWSGVPGVYRRR